MTKYISILGSTGSIGRSALSIFEKKKTFKLNLLSANSNKKIIIYQIRKYKPKYFVITDYFIYKKIRDKFNNKKTKILNNFENLNFKKKTDITISAIPGITGLKPTLNMIRFSKKILIANKESIICGWNLIQNSSIKYKTKIIPVDSEHFSILMLLKNHQMKEIKKIFITASGGPFLNYDTRKFKSIKPSDALRHPTWKMGRKITIDSSTLMNKIFELIEARKLFNIPQDKLDILIHPESLVHAIIQFKNGLTKFLYHETSMLIPLANAIFENNLIIENFYKNKKILKKKIDNLTFQKVNRKTFPIISIKDKIFKYPSTSIIINAANEILVDQFLRKKIPFLTISKTIVSILNGRNYKKYAIRKPKNIKEIIQIDYWAREYTLKFLKNHD